MKALLFKFIILPLFLMGTVSPVLAYVHSFDTTISEHHQSMHSDSQNDVPVFDCDHCCHFSSHSVGVLGHNQMPAHVIKIKNTTEYYRIYHSLAVIPPSRPPILS